MLIVHNKESPDAKSLSLKYAMQALRLQPAAQSRPCARQAIARHSEGMGYSAISRVLGVKPEAIYSWVKKVFQSMAALESERAAAG